jgi:hypothetical protein
MPNWKKVVVSGSDAALNSLNVTNGITVTGSLLLTSSYISTVDYIDFNETGIPTPPDQEGRIYWDEDNGTLSLGMNGGQVVQQVGLEEYFYIKNQSGQDIPNGSVVRAAGTLGASGRILGDLMIADGSITYYFTLGIATETIVNGDDGYVTQFGAVRGIDTTGTAVSESWNDGDVLWVSPTVLGGLTKFEPDSPNLKMQMAIVINAASNGTLFVRPDLSSFLTDLHNVNDFTTTASFGDLLVKSGSTWINTKQLTGSYELTGSIEGGDFSGSFSGSFQGDGSGLTGITASSIPAGVGGIYGGNGTVPLNTTASINGDFTFLGLDEDTRLIVRDGNNGSAIHLFSDGPAGQAGVEFRTQTTDTLLHRIQIAGGDTRYQSNQRDLVFSTSTGSLSSGIFITSSNGDVGIGTVTPNYKLDVNGTTNINGATTITGSVFVHQGNVNIDDNSYFFQGTSVGGSNVSLIGVNLQDQIYIGNQGYTNIVADDTIISGSLTVTSSLTVQGSTTLSGSITTKTHRLTAASYTASASDYRIAVRYTDTGSVAIQLPLISEIGELEYKFKDEEGNAALNNITIVASGSDLIDGDTTAIMNRNYMAIGLYNDGVSNWHIE